jgi:hypothetical protein
VLQAFSATIRCEVSQHRLLKVRHIRTRDQRRQEHSKSIRIALEGVVGTGQQVLRHNPLEIFFLALDAVSRAPVRLDRQECDEALFYSQSNIDH